MPQNRDNVCATNPTLKSATEPPNNRPAKPPSKLERHVSSGAEEVSNESCYKKEKAPPRTPADSSGQSPPPSLPGSRQKPRKRFPKSPQLHQPRASVSNHGRAPEEPHSRKTRTLKRHRQPSIDEDHSGDDDVQCRPRKSGIKASNPDRSDPSVRLSYERADTCQETPDELLSGDEDFWRSSTRTRSGVRLLMTVIVMKTLRKSERVRMKIRQTTTQTLNRDKTTFMEELTLATDAVVSITI